MKKPDITLFIIILIVFMCFVSYASAQVTAERVLPTQGFVPEQIHVVKIRVQGETDECSILEIPPVGWVVSKISNKGTFRDGVILWTPAISAIKPLELTYWLTAPHDAFGFYTFTGTINGQPIVGHSTLEPHIAAGTIEHHLIESGILSDAKQVSKRELSVYLPDEYFRSEKRYPVLYLLHGHGGTNRRFLGNGYPYYSKLINEIYIDSMADRLFAEGSILPRSSCCSM